MYACLRTLDRDNHQVTYLGTSLFESETKHEYFRFSDCQDILWPPRCVCVPECSQIVRVRQVLTVLIKLACLREKGFLSSRPACYLVASALHIKSISHRSLPRHECQARPERQTKMTICESCGWVNCGLVAIQAPISDFNNHCALVLLDSPSTSYCHDRRRIPPTFQPRLPT